MAKNYVRVNNEKNSNEQWVANNPILLDGELIFVITETGIRMKIGDGINRYIDLPFTDDALIEMINSKTVGNFTPEDAGKVLAIDENGQIVPIESLTGKISTWGDLMEGIVIESGETENYGFKKIGTDDEINVKDFNDNVESIDLIANDLSLQLEQLASRLTTIEQNPSSSLVADDLGLVRDEVSGIIYPTLKGTRSTNGLYIEAGGGGSSQADEFFVFTVGSSAFTSAVGAITTISYGFSSKYGGFNDLPGSAKYIVNDVVVSIEEISQGNTVWDCSKYMKVGDNTVTVEVTDAFQRVKSLSWVVNCVEVKMTSTFDYTTLWPEEITFKYIAYGQGIEKTIHFYIDGKMQPSQVVLDNKQHTVNFSGIKHGVHTLESYATANVNGSKIESNHLKYDVMVVADNAVAPLISINNTFTSIVEGELLEIPYMIYDPINQGAQSDINLEIFEKKDGQYQLYKSENRLVNNGVHTWSTRDYPAGNDVKFTISLREVSRSTFVNVKENKLPINPATNDMELYLSSENRSNTEVNPAIWSYENIDTTFNNVNWATSGWLADNTGDITLHLTGGSTATIDFKPFAEELRTFGKTIEFDFAVRDVNRRDANVISCKDGNIGIQITADKAVLSSQLESVECRFHDERRMRVSFVIESTSEYRLMSIYLDGVLTCAKQYVESDHFTQSNPVTITIGSPYCSVDIYNIRSYKTALTQEDLLNNYICDITNITERDRIYNNNNLRDDAGNLVFEKVKTKIPVLVIIGDLPASKGDKKIVNITYEDPFDSSMNFPTKEEIEQGITCYPCQIDVQGTSSQWYVRKNYKLKFSYKIKDDEGNTIEKVSRELQHIKGAIPASVFCVKADYAEATSTHNTQNANFVETLYNDKTPAQEKDARHRSTIQGFPIVIYHQKDAESAPSFLGKYNFNYDKGSESVFFGEEGEYDVESWEFCNNTSAACNFTGNIPVNYSEKIPTGDVNEEGEPDYIEVGWKEDFERRYPDHDPIDEGDEDPTESIARFRAMHDWVVSTMDYDLDDPSMLQRYKTEFKERFNLHRTLIYYVWTFFMLMVDQRAKNMFLTYWGKKDENGNEIGKWEPWFYDNDTCLGINNEGHLIFDYFYEDTDLMDDGSKVYNGQDSTLWAKFRIAFKDEIKATYQDLRNNNKLTYEKVRNQFVVEGSDKWAESIYNEDSDYKYLSMLREEILGEDIDGNGKIESDATNVPQIRGTGEHHLEYFMEGRLAYCDSKWYASDYANDFVVVRVNTPDVSLVDYPYFDFEQGDTFVNNGVTYKWDPTARVINVSGSKNASSESELIITQDRVFTSGAYTLFGGTTNCNLVLNGTIDSESVTYIDKGDSCQIIVPEGKEMVATIKVVIATQAALNKEKVKPQIAFTASIPDANITITPFSDMYAGVRYRAGSSLQQKRLKKDESYTFRAPSSNFNDTETAIYGASQISSLGDLSTLYCNYCDVSKATKLVELKLGSENSSYQSRLATLALGNNKLLRKLDVRNCKSLTSPINLKGCIGISEIYAEGSNISSLELADSGYLKIVHLPESVSTLTFRNQNYIEDFSMPSYDNVTILNVENSAGIPLADILKNTPKLERVRLVKVNFDSTQEELLQICDKLKKCKGLDEKGFNIDTPIVGGIVNVPSIDEDALRQINNDFPELMVCVDSVILCTVRFVNRDGTLLYTTTVAQGADVPDPIDEGLIDIPTFEAEEELTYIYTYKGWNDSLQDLKRSTTFVAMYDEYMCVRFKVDGLIMHSEFILKNTVGVEDPVITQGLTPIKESTIEFDYTYSNWDQNLPELLIEDYMDVNAVFTESVRSYQIRFLNNDNTVIETQTVEYGTFPIFENDTPTKKQVEFPQDYKFLGWTPELKVVEGDADYVANFSESDHILDDWATVQANIENGTYKEKYPLGILQRVTLNHLNGEQENIEVELVGYDHDDLTGGGKAALTFICKGVLDDTHIMNNQDRLNRDSWIGCDMRKYLADDILPALPEDLQSIITSVNKITGPGNGSADASKAITSEDKLWIPSLIELIQGYSGQEIYQVEGNTYDYFKLADQKEASTRRIKYNKHGSSQRYWLRTPVLYGANEFWLISTLGEGISIYASYAKYGVVFGFCIGKANN